MKKFLFQTAALLLAVYLPTAAAQMKVEVIPLQNRPLEQVIPIIQPLVGAGGSVTGMNNQLIVKTTPANLAEIKEVLRNLDTPMRRLMITVRQDVDGNMVRNRSAVDGSYTTGNVSIGTGGPGRGERGAEVSATDADGNTIRWRGVSTQSNRTENNDFRVQTIEGEPAYIQTGQSVPIANQNAYVTGNGVVVQDTVEYHDVTSGFYVIPRLSGNNVTLLVSPNLSRSQPQQGGAFEVQNIETTVQGRLGEWISVGGVNQTYNQGGTSVLDNTRRRGGELRSVLIKVEEIQ
ncbi:MAG: hypothetical protein HW386_863 [Gammaproteobacteria bacterium]|nr:hypothetical protein [Gammaproteobacteria bacterium]